MRQPIQNVAWAFEVQLTMKYDGALHSKNWKPFRDNLGARLLVLVSA